MMSKGSSSSVYEVQKFSWIWIVLVLMLGTLLRLYDLGTESYWSDEMYTVYEVQQTIPQVIESGRLDQPPGYYIPFHFWVQIFGLSEAGTRSFSTLAGVASIFILYLVGKELFSHGVGLLSAFLMSISEFQIYYSQTARFYSLFEFTTLLSFLFFILSLRRKQYLYFILNGVASIFMVYSNVFGLFVLAAQNLFFFLYWKKYKEMAVAWLACQVLIVLAMAPYFYPLLFGASGVEDAAVLNIGNIPPPSLLHPFYAMYRFLLPFRRESGWDLVFVSYAIAGTLLLAGTWFYASRQGKSSWIDSVRGSLSSLGDVTELSEKLTLLGFWLLFPILLPFIVSILMIPIYKVYYTINAAPALYLLLALIMVHARKAVPLLVSLGTVTIMIVPGLVYYYVTDFNPQVRDAAKYVYESPDSGDLIVYVPDGDFGFQNDIEQRLFEWYYEGALPGCSMVGWLKDDVSISGALTQCIAGHDRFWVVIPDSQTESSIRYKSFFLDSGQGAMQLIKEEKFIGLSTYLFELKK